MQQLPTTYNKNGFTFNQINREGDVAIYEQVIPELSRTIAYEVFEVLKKPAATINGVDIPEREACPGNEQWGNYGFTVYDLSEAKQKQAYIAERMRNRQESKTVKQ